jgi:hypothetical protein
LVRASKEAVGIVTIFSNKRSTFLTAFVFFLLVWVAAAAGPRGAAAATVPPKFTQFPEDTATGSGANQFAEGPRALAVDPASGHVYVLDITNTRISDFTAWGEFVKSWGWGVQDGTNELQTCGPVEPEPSPSHSLCRQGIAGSGAGQLDGAVSIAVGPEGDVYLLEVTNHRVQRFSPSGAFVLMFGRDVNKTKLAEGAPATERNVCTAASGDVCGAGVEGMGLGELDGIPSANALAVGPDGTVYVPGAGRIQEFASDGQFLRQITLPEEENIIVGYPQSLFFDPVSGAIGFTYHQGEGKQTVPIYKLAPTTGAVVQELHAEVPDREQRGFVGSLAGDTDGHTFVTFDPFQDAKPEYEPRVLEYGPAGETLVGFDQEFAAPPTEPHNKAIILNSLATNPLGDVYVSESGGAARIGAISAYGPPPAPYGPPPVQPPTIDEQFASSVDTTGATLQAMINPHFWSDTTYYLEYGPQSCEASSCALSAAASLSKQVVNTPLRTAGVLLSNLLPGTTYHYRFVAQSGGGLARGLSGKSGEEAEGTFTTYPTEAPQPPCPGNDAFRGGPAARLPDCRAYEMVSPVDKNGADISVLLNTPSDLAGFDQARPDGEALTYSAYRAFGDAVSSPYTSQYIAARGAGGWQSTGISPPRSGPSLLSASGLESQYGAFSPDLCQGWLVQDTEDPLAEGAFPGYANLYRRDICAGSYAQLAPSSAPVLGPADFRPEIQSFSADGSKAFFRTPGMLTANASATNPQVYEQSGGQLRLVCILPNGAASKTNCTAGSGADEGHPGRVADLQNAVSEDGSVVYWSEGTGGPLYVRVGHRETFAVGSTNSAWFWGAAPDGSRAIFSQGAELRSYDLESHASQPIAGGFAGMLGVSEDATRAYFASKEAIAGSGQNSEGDEAVAGKPNIYLYQAGEPASPTFIATLAAADFGGSAKALRATAAQPLYHASRITPGGNALAFTSAGSLTGYDNSDLSSGNVDAEVYLYRAAGNTLTCVSCNPTGARPRGRNMDESLHTGAFWAAAYIPGAEHQLHFSNLLSEDGQRLFFNATDSLSLRDSNGHQDVYEWEALGRGNCEESSPGFDPKTGGCLSLISSGESPVDSALVDASSDGRDVFFKTGQSLFATDPGLVDIYDARAGGGFPAPPAPPAGCEGEACQGPLAPSEDPTPASSAFQGAGNVKPPAHHRRKHRHHKKRHHKARQHQSGRAGR